MTAALKAVSGTPATSRSDEEWRLRRELAACYRLVAHFKMTDLIFTHISMRVPGPEHHFLINPYGLWFDEITASNLVKIGLDGRAVEPTPYAVNPAGFVIHSAVHGAREDAQCVLHTHTKAGCAIAALKDGLLPVNQMSMEFYGKTAYHDYEGIALELGERERLVADLGDKPAMVLRNHGLLTVGRTIPEAFSYMYNLEFSCRVQLAVMAAGRPSFPPEAVQKKTAAQWTRDDRPLGDRERPALLRLLDDKDPSYRN